MGRILVVILGHEDYSREVDTVFVRVFRIGSSLQVTAATGGGGAAADVGGEENGGEEDEEAKGYGNGVAEAD